MRKIIKYFVVLSMLLLLSISVVNASDNTTTEDNVLEKTTTQVEVATGTEVKEIQTEKENNLKTIKEKIKKNRTTNTKTAPVTVDIDDYDTLNSYLTSSTYDALTISITSNITLTASTTVNNGIKTLTINGNNHTINGNGQYQFLNIPSETTATIKNITITNCTATNGGAISNRGTLTIQDSILNNNNVKQSGGALFNTNHASMTLTGNTIHNNHANGTDTFVGGGAIFNSNGSTMNITGNIINNNTATRAGAIYNIHNANMILIGNTINYNNATSSGGAICNYESIMILTRNTMQNNAGKNGGAVINFNHSDMTITDNTINNNVASDRGGAICNYQSYIVITGNTINNNTATIYAGAIHNEYNASMTITSNIINNNNATIYAGAIHNTYNSSMSITSNTIINNTASLGGAILNTFNSSMNLTGNTFINSTPAEFILNETRNVILNENPTVIPKTSPVQIYIDDREGEILNLTDRKIEDFTAPVGNHTIKLIVKGSNDTYSDNIYILNYEKLIKTQTKITIINNTAANTIVKVTVQDEENNYISNGTITITDETGQTIIGHINNNNETIIRPYYAYGEHNIIAAYTGNQTHMQSNYKVTIKVKHQTNIKIDIINPIENNLTATITVTDENNQPIKQEQINITLPNGSTVTKTTDNEGKISLTEIRAQKGLTTITAHKTENNDYTNTTLTQKINILPDYQNIINQQNQTIDKLNDIIKKLTQPPLNTTITIKPIKSSIGSITKITANIQDENKEKVNSGKAIFKINGITLKDENSNIIYAQVKDGIASINYKVQSVWIKNSTYIEAVYSGTEKYQTCRSNATGILNISKGKAKITLDKKTITAKAGQTITLRAKVLDANGDRVNNDKVVFKINGKTLKDKKGNTLYAKVKDGEAVLEYTIPATYSAKTYTLTAVFGGKYYQRTETNGSIKLEKKAVLITPDSVTTKNKKTTVKATITDETGKLLVTNTKLAFKVKGKTLLNNVKSKNGKIDLSFITTLRPGLYELLIISGENSAYKTGKVTTVLKI